MYIHNSKWKPPIIKLSSRPFQVATYYESYPNFQAPKVFVECKQIWTLGHYALWSPLAKREEKRVRERDREKEKGRERYQRLTTLPKLFAEMHYLETKQISLKVETKTFCAHFLTNLLHICTKQHWLKLNHNSNMLSIHIIIVGLLQQLYMNSEHEVSP